MAERNRAVEDFLRMVAERQAWGGSTDREYFQRRQGPGWTPQEWGGPAAREYVQRRQGLDLTGNRQMDIENLPAPDRASATWVPQPEDAWTSQEDLDEARATDQQQSITRSNAINRFIRETIGIKPAEGAPVSTSTVNDENDVDLPGTMFSRGIDRAWEWSKGDWKKPGPLAVAEDFYTDGGGFDPTDIPNLDDLFHPFIAKKIRNARDAALLFSQGAPMIAGVDDKFQAPITSPPPPNNQLPINDNTSTERALQAGSNIAYQKKAIDKEEDDFLLGSTIGNFINRPEIQNMLSTFAQPEFIQGNFAYRGLGNIAGPWAEAAAGKGSRETEGLEAYAKYLAAQPGPVDLTGEIGERADRSLAGKTALDMVRAIRDVMQGGEGENITGFKSGWDKYGGKLLSFFHAASDMQPQQIVDSLKATLLERYVAAMDLGETRKVEFKTMLDKMITVDGLFRRDEDVYTQLDIMERTLQEQTTLNTRLLRTQGYDIRKLTEPFDFGTYSQSN